MTSPFVWHELLTSDPAAAMAFYAALFGWEPFEGGLGLSGKRLAGVRSSKLHAHWAPFVHVDDPEAAALVAASAGGRAAGRPSSPPAIVLLDARGVPTVVTAAEGEDLFGWHMLESTNVAESTAWMVAITGFTAPPGRGLWRGEAQVGSLLAGAHDRWLMHVVVDDRLAVRARAVQLGGSVEQRDVDASGHGSYDVLVDPQGAAFCVFQGA